MEKKIVETKASYPGVPRVDFLYPDFDALVDNKGYEVIWERAIPCPSPLKESTTSIHL